MRPSLRRLAVAGCVLSAVFVAPASLAAGDSFAQPIQNLPKINLLQTVTHISNGLGKKEVEPKTISRTDKWRFVMAEAATVKGLRIYDPQKTEDAFNFDKDAVGYPFTRTQLRCIMGIDASSTSEAYGIGPMPDSGEVCQRLLELSAEEWLKGSPDKWRDVLGPLRDILKNKGVAPTNDNARYTADKLTDIVRNNPAIANSTSSFEVSNIFEGQREPFRIFPGFMHYLEYVDGIFEKQEKGKLPPDPGFSEEMLRSNTRECREADGTLTNLQCMQTARGNLHHPIKGKIVAGL